MFVYCHLTCVCENFLRRLFTLATTASPLQLFSTTVPIPALMLPEKLARFVDMTAMIAT